MILKLCQALLAHYIPSGAYYPERASPTQLIYHSVFTYLVLSLDFFSRESVRDMIRKEVTCVK